MGFPFVRCAALNHQCQNSSKLGAQPRQTSAHMLAPRDLGRRRGCRPWHCAARRPARPVFTERASSRLANERPNLQHANIAASHQRRTAMGRGGAAGGSRPPAAPPGTCDAVPHGASGERLWPSRNGGVSDCVVSGGGCATGVAAWQRHATPLSYCRPAQATHGSCGLPDNLSNFQGQFKCAVGVKVSARGGASVTGCLL